MGAEDLWRCAADPGWISGHSYNQLHVPRGLEPPVPESLKYHDRSSADGLAGGRRCEVPHQPVDETANFSVKSPVVTKEYAKDLGQREHELPVGQPQQEPLVHVLAQ
jgi:hypothetical protein